MSAQYFETILTEVLHDYHAGNGRSNILSRLQSKIWKDWSIVNKLLKITGTTITGIVVAGIGLFLFSLVAGFVMDEAMHVEDAPIPNEIEVVDVNIGEGIVGTLRWEDKLGGIGTVYFESDVSDEIKYFEENSDFPELLDGSTEKFDNAILEEVESEI